MIKEKYEPYNPSPEEIQKTEEAMTDEQKLMSEAREEGYRIKESGRKEYDLSRSKKEEYEEEQLKEREQRTQEALASVGMNDPEEYRKNLSYDEFYSLAKSFEKLKKIIYLTLEDGETYSGKNRIRISLYFT